MESSIIDLNEEDLKFDCQICLNQIENDKDAFPLINCDHVFHTLCLEKYLKTEIS